MSSLRNTWVFRLGILALFSVLTIAFFWRIFFLTSVYFPIGGDFISFNFPQNVFGVLALQRGEIPLWNPYTMTGQPYAADPNVGFFYPLKMLLVLTVRGLSYREMEYLLISHYFLSGVFAYAAARALGASTAGGVVAGVSFMFSGFLIGQLEHPNIVTTATWLPLVFLFFRRAILGGRIKDAMCAGVFLAVSVFGGHQQYSVLMILAMALWLVGYWLFVSHHTFGRDCALFALALVISAAIASVQILPALQLTIESMRGQLVLEEAAALNLPPLGWITLIMPHFYSENPQKAQSLWSGYGNLNEIYGYVGVVTLFLALIGIPLHWMRTGALRRYEIGFLIALGFLGLMLATGTVTPLFGWAYTLVPILHFLRVPARFLFWFDFSVPLLAAFGIDFFRTPPRGERGRLWQACIVGVTILLAGSILMLLILPTTTAQSNDIKMLGVLATGLLTTLIFSRLISGSRTLLITLVIALLVFDLVVAQGTYNFTTHDPLEGFRHPSVIERIKPESTLYRVDALPEALNDWQPLTGLMDPVPMAFGLPWNPFDLNAFKEYWNSIDRDGRAYDFLSVKFLVAPRGAVLGSKWVRQPVEDTAIELYENSQAMPRALVVFQSIVEPDRARALEVIRSGNLDPSRVVLLESGTPLSAPPANSDVQIMLSSNNRLILRTITPQAGYLVLSDAYYPGWRVWVDDREREILRANYAFRAVYLPEGTHTVRFEFDPLSWRIGLDVTVLTCAGLGLAGVAYATMSLKARRVTRSTQSDSEGK